MDLWLKQIVWRLQFILIGTLSKSWLWSVLLCRLDLGAPPIANCLPARQLKNLDTKINWLKPTFEFKERHSSVANFSYESHLEKKDKNKVHPWGNFMGRKKMCKILKKWPAYSVKRWPTGKDEIWLTIGKQRAGLDCLPGKQSPLSAFILTTIILSFMRWH